MDRVPLYPFACAACGPFDVQRPMAAAAEPADCPQCAERAVRIYTAPGSTTRTPGAMAEAVDERSRHAPERVTRAPGGGHGHDHGGASHNSSPGRPWQISH
jgi:putative FmdB family regulatory protein